MVDTHKDAITLLEQILGTGQALIAKGAKKGTELIPKEMSQKAKDLAHKGEDYLADKLGINDTPASRSALRKGMSTGAAAGGLALLLSSRSARKLAALGGISALGILAYKAYQGNGGKMPSNLDDAISVLKGEKAEARAEILIRAMIAAARADGTVNEDELAIIRAHRATSEEGLKLAMDQTDDPKAIARLANSPQAAREIYAVSCRVADGLNPKERDYLDGLAMALKLDPETAAHIETDMRTG